MAGADLPESGNPWDRIYVVGAGPGAPDLITVRGQRLLAGADVIVYAGSLVNPILLDCTRPDAERHDSAGMDLPDIVDLMISAFRAGRRVVRLQTGDTSLFSALAEQMRKVAEADIPVEVVPGVSSAMAAAAALGVEFTLPEVAQSVIFTRMAGRTPVPEREALSSLASHGTTMVLFLSTQMIHKVVAGLEASYPPETPVAVVYKASWPEQRIVRGTLSDIVEKVRESGIKMTALIVVGEVLNQAIIPDSEFRYSKLYDPGFSHGFRTRSEAPS
ncbi:MAG: precorrin-4 C(11)-methyltransferase [Leptospirillia bacterium]